MNKVFTSTTTPDLPQLKSHDLFVAGMSQRITFTLKDLIRIFGSEEIPNVPLTAQSAEVVFEPNNIARIIWTCALERSIAERMGLQDVLAENDATIAKRSEQ